jgi:hypothetical protein
MSWNMRPTKDLEPWDPLKYVASCCGDVIWSPRPGQFKSCKCGKAYVDQTREYSRLSGVLKVYVEDSEQGLE